MALKSTASRRIRETDNLAWSTFRISGGLTMNTRYSRGVANSVTESMRHEGVTRFPFLQMRHRILAGYEYQSGKSQSRTLQGPPAVRYNPRTDPLVFMQREISRFNPAGLPGMRLTNASAPVRAYYIMEQGEAWDPTRAAVDGSSFFDLPAWLHWCTGNIGFHHIHHLASQIPNYRLKQCFRENPELPCARLTIRESLRCLRLRLWDEDSRTLVGFEALREASPAVLAPPVVAVDY